MARRLDSCEAQAAALLTYPIVCLIKLHFNVPPEEGRLPTFAHEGLGCGFNRKLMLLLNSKLAAAHNLESAGADINATVWLAPAPV